MEGGPRRLTLWEQMSATEGVGLSGLSLDDVLGTSGKRGAASPPIPRPAAAEPPVNTRTLLDVIRDEDPNSRSYKGLIQHRDKKSWKTFKDKLRLKRAGAAWISSVHIPTSDIPINRSFHSHSSRRNSARYQTEPTQPGDLNDNYLPSSAPSGRPQIVRWNSTRFEQLSPPPDDSTQFDDDADALNPSTSPPLTLGAHFARHNSTRFGNSMLYDDEDDSDEEEEDSPHAPTRQLSAVLEEARALSAREAVAAQEAGEAAAAAEREASGAAEIETEEEVPVVRMSLMDLMDYDLVDDDEEEEVEEEVGNGEVGEYNCCVCMVRHKGAAFIPCGHTFCRLCSRELLVTRGNCPLCNRFILEILDIF